MKQEIAAVVDRATGLALQADARAAADALAQLLPADLDGDAAAFRNNMMVRFWTGGQMVDDFRVDDSWVFAIVEHYTSYWHVVLTKEQTLNDAEAVLRTEVGRLMGRPLETSEALDEIEPEILAELTKRGYYALMGRTMPLLELMLWKSQRVSEEEVHLPEQDHRMRVTYLDDFVLRGWGQYATCGRRSTGGWATEEGLFAVVPAYKRLDDETFTVRFLAHEAQHSIDMRTFGKLDPWELEYRAKLTEVALSQDIQADTFRRFCENASDASKDAPHAYANALILNRLADRMRRIGEKVDFCSGLMGDAEKLRKSARELLREDTQLRKKV